MEIVDMPIEQIKPYKKNPRKNEKAIPEVVKSLKEFGFRQPLVVDSNMVLIAGHTRLLAAKELGLAKVPVHIASTLTPAQVRAYRITDNRSHDKSEWSIPELSEELDALFEMDEKFDLDFMDFSLDDLDREEEPKEGLTDPDEVPEDVEPRVKLGQVWQLGDHRLMCGDSTSRDDINKLMNGHHADICFTSPPYNAGSMEIDGNKSTQKKYKGFDDNQTDTDFFKFITSNLNCMLEVCTEVFYNIGLVERNKRVVIDIMSAFRSNFKDMIYWKKTSSAPHIQPGVINNKVEAIICFGQINASNRKFANAQFSQGTYWNVIEGANASGNDYADIHKATFPVYLPENIIKNFCPPRGSVVDCFCGTGTSIIASEKLGRICYGMELDPAYCDVIIERWEKYTGETASLLS